MCRKIALQERASVSSGSRSLNGAARAPPGVPRGREFGSSAREIHAPRPRTPLPSGQHPPAWDSSCGAGQRGEGCAPRQRPALTGPMSLGGAAAEESRWERLGWPAELAPAAPRGSPAAGPERPTLHRPLASPDSSGVRWGAVPLSPVPRQLAGTEPSGPGGVAG